MNIFITADFTHVAVNRLKANGHAVRLGGWGVTEDLLSEDELIKELGNSDVLIVGYEPITPKVLDATNLKG